MVAECQTQLHKTKVTKQVALAVSKRIKDDAAATEQEPDADEAAAGLGSKLAPDAAGGPAASAAAAAAEGGRKKRKAPTSSHSSSSRKKQTTQATPSGSGSQEDSTQREVPAAEAPGTEGTDEAISGLASAAEGHPSPKATSAEEPPGPTPDSEATVTEEAPVAGLGTGLMDDAGSDPAGAASEANFSQVEAGAELTADADCGTLGSPAAPPAAAAAAGMESSPRRCVSGSGPGVDQAGASTILSPARGSKSLYPIATQRPVMRDGNCLICYKENLELFEFGCGAPREAAHIMCSTCTRTWAARGRNCPFCRRDKAPPHTENHPGQRLAGAGGQNQRLRNSSSSSSSEKEDDDDPVWSSFPAILHTRKTAPRKAAGSISRQQQEPAEGQDARVEEMEADPAPPAAAAHAAREYAGGELEMPDCHGVAAEESEPAAPMEAEGSGCSNHDSSSQAASEYELMLQEDDQDESASWIDDLCRKLTFAKVFSCLAQKELGSERHVAADAVAAARQVSARALSAYLSQEGKLLAGLSAVKATDSWRELGSTSRLLLALNGTALCLPTELTCWGWRLPVRLPAMSESLRGRLSDMLQAAQAETAQSAGSIWQIREQLLDFTQQLLDDRPVSWQPTPAEVGASVDKLLSSCWKQLELWVAGQDDYMQFVEQWLPHQRGWMLQAARRGYDSMMSGLQEHHMRQPGAGLGASQGYAAHARGQDSSAGPCGAAAVGDVAPGSEHARERVSRWIELTHGKYSYSEALEIDAYVNKHPVRSLHIIYGVLNESRLMSPDREAVTLGMLLQLLSLALKDEQSVFKSKEGMWVPRALPPGAQALEVSVSPSKSLRTLFDPIFSYCSQSLHVTRIGREEHDHERQFLVPYKAALFPDPEQPAEKCSNVQLEAVAAIVDEWTFEDCFHLMTESIAPGLLKAARMQK